jgi:hypothetical protein
MVLAGLSQVFLQMHQDSLRESQKAKLDYQQAELSKIQTDLIVRDANAGHPIPPPPPVEAVEAAPPPPQEVSVSPTSIQAKSAYPGVWMVCVGAALVAVGVMRDTARSNKDNAGGQQAVATLNKTTGQCAARGLAADVET